MPNQSHEDMIKEFAKLAGNMTAGNKTSKWKLIAKKTGVHLLKNVAAFGSVLALTVLGWVCVNAAFEIGLITWNITLWQAVRLFGPILLAIIVVPMQLTVRLKQ